MKRLLIPLLTLLSATAAQAQWGFGAEGNDRQAYVWLTRYEPVISRPQSQVLLFGTVSWRRYEPGPFESVSGPGLAAGAMYRRTTANWSGGVGAGWDVRWLDYDIPGETRSETSSGPALMGDVSARIADRMTLGAGANYWGADEWLATSGHLLYDVTPSLRVGPEIGFDGNDDLDVRRYGAIVGFPQGQRWLYLRGGQATTEDRFGNETTEPYFSAGISGRF